MATYLELSNIASEAGWGEFTEKVKTACIIKATAIVDSATPAAEALAWAKSTLVNPSESAKGATWYVIGANESAIVAQIVGAIDGDIQANVDAAIDAIYK